MNLETIYIVRHGVAEDYSASGSDAARRLTDVGIDKTLGVARGMKAIGVRPDLILTSPLRRADETARIVARELGDVAVRVAAEMAPRGDFDALAQEFFGAPKPRKVMVVGHQPDLGQLASWLVTGDPAAAQLPFRRAATACFDVYGAPESFRGVLQWFMTPAQLRAVRS